jgi:hypothetical protein
MIFEGFPGGTQAERIHPSRVTGLFLAPGNQLSIRSQIPSGLISRYPGIQVSRYTGILVSRLTVTW